MFVQEEPRKRLPTIFEDFVKQRVTWTGRCFGRSGASAVVAALLALSLAGCGKDSNPAGPGGGDGPMSAVINGEAWVAGDALALAQPVPNTPGAFIVNGTEAFVAGGPLRTISLSLYNVAGPGTYPFGVNLMVPGGNAILANTTSGWGTPLSGAAGTITITALDASRIAGTFAFTADATTGSATGQVVVTDGEFDLPLPGTPLLPIPDNAISRASVTVDGQPWNAATLSGTTAGGNFVLTANNLARNLTIVVQGAAPGTFPLSAAANVQFSDGSGTGPECCWGHGTGATGSITISSQSASRISGTFDVTLVPVGGGATNPISLTGGTFDIGLH